MLTLKNRNAYLLSILVSAITISIPAFINNFPFLYADTGTYIHIGFTNEISEIRPLLYGLFLRHVSLYESLWLVIFVQALIVAWVIFRFTKAFFPAIPAFVGVLGISVLTFTTGIGVTTGMLMPDFLTPVMVLLSAIIIFSENRSWRYLAMPVLILWLAIACHHSHPYILFVLLLGFSFISLIVRRKLTYGRGLLLVLIIAAVGYFTIPALHYMRKGEFVRSHSSNVFLVGRIQQMGLLKPFLDKSCQNKDYTLCTYKDSIPVNFLWSQQSPVYQDGGWAANNARYKEVVHDFFSQAFFVKKFAIKALETTVQQLFSFDVVIIVPEGPNGYPYNVVKEYLPEFIPAIELSLQFSRQWNNKPIDFVQRILVFASGLFLLYLFFYQRKWTIRPIENNLALFVILGLLANAFICGCVSMVDPRFQSRLVWILPLFAMMLMYHVWDRNLLTQDPSNSGRT